MSHADETTSELRNIVALTCRAETLRGGALYARAADKVGEAATAMDALDCEPDNLVAVLLRAKRLSDLLAAAYDTGFEPAGRRAAVRQDALLELPRAITALRRREAARTLLRGRCRALEEAFHCAMELEHFKSCGLPLPKQHKVDVVASLVGYYAFMVVAEAACCYFLNVVYREQLDEAETALTCDLMVFVASALDYIHSGVMVRRESFCAEGDVARMVRKALEEDRVLPLDTDAGRKLCSAWRRLKRSGELTGPRLTGWKELEDAVKTPHPLHISAATLYCEMPECGAPEMRAGAFKKCGACKKALYCCKEHQVDDWPRHKAACKAARAAAAAGAPSA